MISYVPGVIPLPSKIPDGSPFPGLAKRTRQTKKGRRKWITGVNPGYDTVMVMPVIQVVSLPVNGSVGRFNTAEIV